MKLGFLACSLAGLATVACQDSLDTTRTPDSYASFGAVIYREACQRIAYTGQLDQKAAGAIDRVDVSGSLGRSVCVAGAAPPPGAPPRLSAIAGQQPEVVRLVNVILPDAFLDTFESFLERILPLYDDGTMQDTLAGLGQMMGQLHDDPAIPAGLARIGARHGYRPAEQATGLIEAVLEYPRFDPFIGSLAHVIGPRDPGEAAWNALLAGGSVALGSSEREADPASPDRTLRLAVDLLLHRALDASDPALVTGSPMPAVRRDVRGMALVNVDAANQLLPPFVDLDRDGLADVDARGRFVDAQGNVLAVPTPFAVPGTPDDSPRDALGRAVVAAGDPTTLYQYLDLDGTFLVGLAREAVTLLDPDKDTALGLVWGASALLGPRAMQTRTYSNTDGTPAGSVSFNGFDLNQSAVLDLLHSFVQLLGAPQIDQVLRATDVLLGAHEPETARAIAAMLDTSDAAKLHTEAQIPADSTLYDDLAPLIGRTLAVPGLGVDVVKALANPHVRGLTPMIARLMNAVDQIDFKHDEDVSQTPKSFDVINNLDHPTPVDRAQPDADYNRSLMQRISHLIHDSNGSKFCNKDAAMITGVPGTFAACKMFEIKDLALFFALNLASDPIRMDKTRFDTTYSKASFREQVVSVVVKSIIADTPIGDTSIENLTKIDGFTRFPSPKALARALFLRPGDAGRSDFLASTMDPVLCRDGDRFIDVHDKSIFAWELGLPGNPSGFADDTFYDAVRPLIDAFASHDECLARDATGTCTQAQNAVKIFIDLLAVLHEHWGSPRSSYFGHGYQATDRTQPRFAFADNVVSYEPFLIELLNGELTNSLLDFATMLWTLDFDGTTGTVTGEVLPVMASAMGYVFDPGATPAGVAYRDGRTTSVQSDGVTVIPRATVYDLIADAFRAKRNALASLAATTDGAPKATAWTSAAKILVDLILTVDHPQAGGSYQFHNRRLHAMTRILVDFLRNRVQSHAAIGDLDGWSHRELTADLTDKIAGPVFAALGDLTTAIENDPTAHAELYGLLNYLLDESGHDPVFRIGVTLAADQLQQFLDDAAFAPITRVIGQALDPMHGVVRPGMSLVSQSYDLDTDKALLTVLHALFQPDASGHQQESDLADLVCKLDRSAPGGDGDLDASDEASVLAALRDFFGDNQRGFLRFANIVHNRNGVSP